MNSIRRFLPLILILAPILPAFAQQQPQHTILPDTIFVGADGKYDAEADTAVVQFNISTQENKLKPAYERAQKAAEQVRDILRSNGIDPKEATISSFRISPLYDWKGSGKRKLIAYRVNSAVTIKLKDFSKVAGIADEFANLDVTEEQSISYIVESTETAKSKAVEDAMRRAKASAEIAARAGCRQLGNLVTATIDVNETAILPLSGRSFERFELQSGLFDKKQAVPPPPPPPPPADFSAEKVTITAHVNALFGIK